MTAYRRRPVRSSRTASATTHASPICSGREFMPAAHQVKGPRLNGQNRYTASGTISAGRSPISTRSSRSTARDAATWRTISVTANGVHWRGKSRYSTPCSSIAAGMKCPPRSSTRYWAENSGFTTAWVPYRTSSVNSPRRLTIQARTRQLADQAVRPRRPGPSGSRPTARTARQRRSGTGFPRGSPGARSPKNLLRAPRFPLCGRPTEFRHAPRLGGPHSRELTPGRVRLPGRG